MKQLKINKILGVLFLQTLLGLGIFLSGCSSLNTTTSDPNLLEENIELSDVGTTVTPLDALIVINDINANARCSYAKPNDIDKRILTCELTDNLGAIDTVTHQWPWQVSLQPLDALIIINDLNANARCSYAQLDDSNKRLLTCELASYLGTRE